MAKVIRNGSAGKSKMKIYNLFSKNSTDTDLKIAQQRAKEQQEHNKQVFQKSYYGQIQLRLKSLRRRTQNR